MKPVAAWLLRLVTLISPVFIAACYGMPFERHLTGKVVASATGLAIQGIKVSCASKPDGGYWYLNIDSAGYQLTDGGYYVAGTPSVTDGSGNFDLRCRGPVEHLLAQDIDGAEHGGPYADKAVPVPQSDDTSVIIAMDIAAGNN